MKHYAFMGIEPQTKCCYNCQYYHQHYGKWGGEIFAGHCTYPRLKDRKPTDVCVDFRLAEDRNAG